MGVCRRQTDCRGLQGASPRRVQCLGTGPGLRSPHRSTGVRPASQTEPEPPRSAGPARGLKKLGVWVGPAAGTSPEPSNRKPNWPRSETSGPEQTRADLSTGLGSPSPAAARVLPQGPLDANENQEKRTTSVPSLSGPLPGHLPQTPRRPRRSS